MPSVIRGTDNFDSQGIVEGTSKAWVYFNGTGTPTINDSYNTSSLTDITTGHYQANFSVPLSSGNIAISIASNAEANNALGNRYGSAANTTATSVQFLHFENNALIDPGQMAVVFFANP